MWALAGLDMPAAFPLSDAQNKSDEAGRRGSVLPGGWTGLLAGGAAPQGAAVHVIQHVDYGSIIFIGTAFRNMKTPVNLLVYRIQNDFHARLTHIKSGYPAGP
jgi:hypothetical protein